MRIHVHGILHMYLSNLSSHNVQQITCQYCSTWLRQYQRGQFHCNACEDTLIKCENNLNNNNNNYNNSNNNLPICVVFSQYLCVKQVSHHPTVVACHCEGRGWKFYADSNIRSKFWGRSIQLDPVGVLTLEFDDGEIFQWSKVIKLEITLFAWTIIIYFRAVLVIWLLN